MPIVVREMIIRARLDEGSNGQSRTLPASSINEDIQTEEIVALCVEKVMETMERIKER